MPPVHGDPWTNIHAVLTFIVPVLVGLIAVKYQGKTHSPFDTHPITAFLSIFSLILYCSLSLPLVAQLLACHTTCGARTFHFLRILSFSLYIALLTLLLFRGLSFFLLYLPLLMVVAARLCSLLRKLLRLRREIVTQLLPLTAADRHWVSEAQYKPAVYHSSSAVAQEEIMSQWAWELV